jgi:8-oxo-dGTP diphosphatase
MPDPGTTSGQLTGCKLLTTKIGLALTEDSRLLTVRKRGGTLFILPGGKPQGAESDEDTLRREVREELSCDLVLETLQWIGEFVDEEADNPGRTVQVRVYSAEIEGEPHASSEIEEIRWFDPGIHDAAILAPSIRNQILTRLGLVSPFQCQEHDHDPDVGYGRRDDV